MDAPSTVDDSSMTRKISVSLNLPSEQHLNVLRNALLPETKRPTTVRSKVTLRKKQNTLIMQIYSTDTSALRATLNSYLQWMIVVNDVLKLMAKSI